jgi:hypothetical protein
MRGAHENNLSPEWELYDLQTDPLEMHNIYNKPENANLIIYLKKELKKLQEKYGDTDATRNF